MKTLYVSDLDGTLLNSECRIPAEAVEALNRAISSGALFTVATARTPATLAGIMKNVNLRLPAIVMTGATIWDRNTNSYSDTHHFPPSTARRVLDIYLRHRIPTFLYALSDNMINIYHLGPMSAYERDFVIMRLKSPFKRFHLSPLQKEDLFRVEIPGEESSPKNILLNDRIWIESAATIPEVISDAVLFFGMQPKGKPALDDLYEDLKRIPDINPIIYVDTVYPDNVMIEAFPEKATKANAIKKMAADLGADRIVVFGDNRNDLPMMQIADMSVAVDNAIPEVKEKAYVVIGNCNSGAVADFILDDFLTDKNILLNF